MITYRSSLDGIEARHLEGFFEGWPSPPSPDTHLRILQGSSTFVLAVDSDSDSVVGFVTAISDGVLSAYLPLLEVRTEHRGRGIGRELVRRVLETLQALYMVDLSCDPELRAFYEELGFREGTAMMRRNYDAQAGAPEVER